MNQLYQGDNLAILREMPDASVDLICTDPPFNTGKDWGAFNDKWEGGIKGYLKFMEPRCVEMRRVLKDTGSLYLHCDPTASHYLKVMLDGVFGIKQFRNEIVWHYLFSRPRKQDFTKSHSTIFRYSKSDDRTWNQLYEPKTETTLNRYGIYKTKQVTTEKGTQINIATDEVSLGSQMRDVWRDIRMLIWSAKENQGLPNTETRCPLRTHDQSVI